MQRNFNVNIFKVVFPRSFNFNELHPFTTLQRKLNITDVVQVLTRQAFGISIQGAEITLEHNLSAMMACERAYINDLVGGPDDLFIMLHNNDRIPQIAQTKQNTDQALGVARMKTDAGLIQNIHRSDKVASKCGGKVNAL